MQYFYCYKITFTDTSHIYFGSRASKRPPEEDTKYMGSPKTYKQYWIDFTPVKTILKTGFESYNETVIYEADLIRSQWQGNKGLSLNDHIPGENFHGCGSNPSTKTREKLSAANLGNIKGAKSYVGISPDNKLFRFTSALKFIKNNPDWNFSCSSISKCANGGLKIYKGWRFFFEEDYEKIKGEIPPIVKKSERNFVGVSPDGDTYFFTNACKFCRDNPNFNLTPGGISNCANGGSGTHRGWRFFFREDYDALNGILPALKKNLSPPETRFQSKKDKTIVGIHPVHGIVYFSNHSEFIRENPAYKLHHSCISDCLNGKQSHHKDWQFFYKKDFESVGGVAPLIVGKPSNIYIAISPNGDRYKFTNAKKFCRDYPHFELNPSCVTGCARGMYKHHKGWKFSYADESDIA